MDFKIRSPFSFFFLDVKLITEISCPGDIYEGKFVKGKRCGKGEMKWKNGASYMGTWKDDKFEGLGKFLHKDGSEYQGQWKANQKSGKGVFINADKTFKYTGDWANDKRQGEGTVTTPNYTYSGTWHNDRVSIFLFFLESFPFLHSAEKWYLHRDLFERRQRGVLSLRNVQERNEKRASTNQNI